MTKFHKVKKNLKKRMLMNIVTAKFLKNHIAIIFPSSVFDQIGKHPAQWNQKDS